MRLVWVQAVTNHSDCQPIMHCVRRLLMLHLCFVVESGGRNVHIIFTSQSIGSLCDPTQYDSTFSDITNIGAILWHYQYLGPKIEFDRLPETFCRYLLLCMTSFAFFIDFVTMLEIWIKLYCYIPRWDDTHYSFYTPVTPWILPTQIAIQLAKSESLLPQI